MTHLDHHHHGCDNEHHHHHHHLGDRHAPDCDDQMPLLAHAGRGIKGDSLIAHVADPDSCIETYIEGWSVDEATGEHHSEWITENINGGELSYQYNLRPYTDPRTFTITFIYRRPGRHEWSWTTPAIPYIWTYSEDGGLDDSPDHVVGSGVATLFVRTMHTDWNERLHYPIDPNTGQPYSRDTFNAPEAEEAWSSTITFGYGGDIEVPDLDDIAKIIGITKKQLQQILEGDTITINGIDARNLIEYIDKCDKRDRDHFHDDLGFNKEGHGNNAFGTSPITNQSYANVKTYIDEADKALRDRIAAAEARIKKLEDMMPTIPDDMSLAYGNINILSSDSKHAIITHSGNKEGDIKAE